MWKLFLAGMHSSIVAACLAASTATGVAATDEELRDAMHTAITYLYDCYKKQSIHALNSDRGMGEDSFVTVVKGLCREQQNLYFQGLTSVWMERGASSEEFGDKIAPMIVEQDRQLRSIYRQFGKR